MENNISKATTPGAATRGKTGTLGKARQRLTENGDIETIGTQTEDRKAAKASFKSSHISDTQQEMRTKRCQHKSAEKKPYDNHILRAIARKRTTHALTQGPRHTSTTYMHHTQESPPYMHTLPTTSTATDKTNLVI